MDPVSERRIEDAELTKNVALPIGATTANTAALDLGKAKPFPLTEAFHVKLTTEQATGANSKNITVKMQDSADGTTFADIDEVAPLVVTEYGGNYPAGEQTVQLPPSTRRYIRAQATGESNGGDPSAGVLTATPLF